MKLSKFEVLDVVYIIDIPDVYIKPRRKFSCRKLQYLDDTFIIFNKKPYEKSKAIYVNYHQSEIIDIKRNFLYDLCKVDDPSIILLNVDIICLEKANMDIY